MKRRTDIQLATAGFSALAEKLGLADALRFVMRHESGNGDYTREREQWLGRLSTQEVRTLMRKAEKKRRSPAKS